MMFKITSFLCLSLIMATLGTNFSVATINVRGLASQNLSARWHKLQSLLSVPHNFYLLQETHSRDDIIDYCKEKWPGESRWCPAPSTRSAGVAILQHPDDQSEIMDVKMDNDGRVICVHVCTQESHFQILNVYAPHKHTSRNYFFSNILNYTFPGLPVVLAGDFNCIEDPVRDTLSLRIRPQDSGGMQQLNHVKDECDLVDLWRKLNPKICGYTWSDPSQHSQNSD